MEENLSTMMRAQGLNLDQSNMAVKKDATILTMYLELMTFYYDQKGNKETAEMLIKALNCFGNQRYMVIEEDDE